jgi:hypothetical protein
MPRCTRQQALEALDTLRLRARPAAGVELRDQTAKLVLLADDLTEHDAADVAQALRQLGRRLRTFPSLAEIVDAIEAERDMRRAREKARALPPPDMADPWALPWQALGIGLQIARGQCLLETGHHDVAAAQARFNDLVHALGFQAAKRIADERYHPGGDHKQTLQALDEAAGTRVAA